MHRTRSEVSNLWPIPRKGTRFVVISTHNDGQSIPVLIVLRDMLKIAKTRSEAKRIILSEKVKVNGKVIKDEKYPLALFDVLGIDAKNYKIMLKNKKFSLEETKAKEKISKIIGKKILRNGKVQINLNDGRNFLGKEKINTGDSAVYNFADKKIEKIIPLKENANVIVISGSHIGEEGKIEKINEEKGEAEVKLGKEKINFKLKMLMAI
jgi:small subunit ribosomal protein S4e